MLSALTLKQLDLIVANLPKLIQNSFSAYELNRGKFQISSEKKLYEEIYYDLFITILKRIENVDPLTVLPLYDKIAYMLVNLQFDVPLFLELTNTIKSVIFEFLLKQGGRNNQLEQYLDKYIFDITTVLTQEKLFQKGLKADQLIQLIEEYAPSSTIIRNSFGSKELIDRKIYSLIDRDRYWEVQKEEYIRNKTYSTRSISIYNNQVYILNQNVSKPSIDKFNLEEWGEFRSKFLNKGNTFSSKLKANLKVYMSNALENAEDINGIISDSKIKEISSDITYDEKDLNLTFGGKGKSVIENILTLKTTLNYFGSYEGSPIGNVDFISAYSEYLYGALYGRIINGGFTEIGGIKLLGNFNFLFSYPSKINRIAGLNFLESFKSLKSFNQNITLPSNITLTESDDKITTSVIYNPVYAKYSKGVPDRYFYEEINPYMDNIDVDIILFGIEQLQNVSNALGDTIQAIRESLDDTGILPGYEGLGSISIQLEELSKVFVSTTELEANYANSKVLPGFNGIVKYLLTSYNRLASVVTQPYLTGESLSNLSVWGRQIQEYLERLVAEIKGIGYVPGSFIPNISFKTSSLEREKLVDQLRSLNFQESEIDQFLAAETFEELLTKFAPISDSADQISFFRAYELSQLIYEFGGESAIDAYIGYLYQRDNENLTNLLSIAIKSKTSGTVYNEYRYGKLVGLLINLTFAINPDQLTLFKNYLSGNNLTLFESISYLLQNREANIILDQEKINLLKPLSESLIYGKSLFSYDSPSIDYQVANKEAPLALKNWTNIINYNLGDASTNLIQNLFNKSVGLTPKELITILNTGTDHNHNDYGQLIDGYEGGRLTKLINYGYVSGLIHKLSYYSNSYQVPNFYIRENVPLRLDRLVMIVDNLSNLLGVTLINFANSLEYNLSQDSVDLYSFDNIINAQNKEISEISSLIKDLVPVKGDITNFGSPKVPGEAKIIGSPGIGNSPVPESITKEGYITPEQAGLLSPQIKNTFSFIANKSEKDTTSSDVINKFITFIEDNKLIVGASAKEAIVEANSNILKISSDQKTQEALGQIDRKIDVKLPLSFQENKLQSQIQTNNIINLSNKGLISNFDAVESCKRFGGENCETRIPTGINSCAIPINKSIYSQRDDTNSTTKENGSIGIDRPYGSSSEIKPGSLFLPYSENNKPAYFKLFEDDVKISTGGNPIRSTIGNDPFVFIQQGDAKEAVYPSYYNSEYGLIEAIKAKWEKDEPFKCSLLDDPYAYMACMNLLKCKRFKRGEGVASLKFCPKTLAGGLLK